MKGDFTHNGDLDLPDLPEPPLWPTRAAPHLDGSMTTVMPPAPVAARPVLVVAAPELNPKDRIGQSKPGLRSIPPIALLEEGIIMQDGADKYGPFNWQENPIQASIYYDAILRHLLAWYTGEDVDPGSKSGGKHLAAVRASCGILLDAFATGRVIDDRPTKTASAAEAIKRLAEQRAGKAP
jgi:hypothetical protein